MRKKPAREMVSVAMDVAIRRGHVIKAMMPRERFEILREALDDTGGYVDDSSYGFLDEDAVSQIEFEIEDAEIVKEKKSASAKRRRRS
ncbi:MAG TPA: hypothetical protein VKP14_06250 [Gaiellaceae bacterium]|nr:hypothetical protein [Gaiellaceae bacterium]